MNTVTDDKLLTDEELAQVEAGDLLPIYRLLFTKIRQHVQAGSKADALLLLELLEDGVTNEPVVHHRVGHELRSLRYHNEVRVALEAGAEPNIPAVQASQRKKGGRVMSSPRILQALRDLGVYKPGKVGRKPTKSRKPK